MNPIQIKEHLEEIKESVALKGYYMPNATFYVSWLSYELTINIEYRTSADESRKNIFVHGTFKDGEEHLFVRASAKVFELPSIENAKRDAFIASVGKLIDQGREIGIEVDFLNPLTEMMKKLSSNAITHQPE